MNIEYHKAKDKGYLWTGGGGNAITIKDLHSYFKIIQISI